VKFLQRSWPGFASAILLLAAFPPFHLSLLVFIALTPWLASLRESGARPFRSGFGFGLIYFLGQMFWIVPFVSKWTGSTALALVPWLLAGLIVAPFFGLAGWLIQICWRRNQPWLIPLVWAGVEVLRSFMPGLAFPWGLIATPLADIPFLMGLGHYGFIYLASAWCVLPSLALVQAFSGEGFVCWRGPAIAFAAGLMLSITYWSQPATGTPTTIMIGQPGVDLAFGDPATQQAGIYQAVEQILPKARNAKVSLLVLPEGISGATVQLPPSPSFRVEKDVPVIFGGERGDKPRYQTAFAYDGKWSYADKTRLVVFGEYVPGRDWIPFITAFKLPSGDLTPATKVTSLDVNGIRTGPLLCFEGLFSDVAFKHAKNGAQLLTIMSIDDWYMGTNAPEQLAMAAPWRAVETGLPLARAATLGISLACDARGNVLAQAPLKETRALPVRVSLPAGQQNFRWAPVFSVVALLSLVGVPLYDWFARRSTSVIKKSE